MDHNTRYLWDDKVKLALQAAGYTPSPTQGVALGWYKLAFQAVSVPITFIKGLEDFDTLFECCTLIDRNRDMYIE